MRAEILALLREKQDYVSGQEICEKFGVSRTAVWKAINQLKKEGFQIEAVQNKGYMLSGGTDVFTKSELNSRIHTKWAGKNLHFFQEIDSTNIKAKQLAEEGATHGTLVIANEQVAGRGRRGKLWESPPGVNIYFTLLSRPEIEPNRASMLTLVMAVSVAKAIEEVAGVEAGIKWPNDIVVQGKKIVGILTEMSAEPDFVHYIVTGVGINVDEQEFPEELLEKATYLSKETNKKISRTELLVKILEHFEEDYDKFMLHADLTELLKPYEERLVNLGKEVKVLDPQEEFTGKALAITKEGELLVSKEDGTVKKVYAGEVSVRGIYGYV